MPALRVCSFGGCGVLVGVRQERCPAHRSAESVSKPRKRVQRYGRVHEAQRAVWEPLVAAGGVSCVRCGELIEPGSDWDLGHPDSESPGGPEHRGSCNRSAGARFGNQKRRRV